MSLDIHIGAVIMFAMALIGALFMGIMYLGEYAEKKELKKESNAIDTAEKSRKYITSMGIKKV